MDAEDPESRIRQKYSEAFAIAERVNKVVEQQLLTPHRIGSSYARAMDLLMIQAYKSHSAVLRLLSHAFCEDAATLTRRLLETAIQVGYLTYAGHEQWATEKQVADDREQRAELYLAQFWKAADEILQTSTDLPEHIRTFWQALYDAHKDLIRSKGFWWGGTMRDLFRSVNATKEYETSYAFLSSVAHASAYGVRIGFALTDDGLILHDDRFVRPLIKQATQYLLASVMPWGSCFRLLSTRDLENLGQQVDAI